METLILAIVGNIAGTMAGVSPLMVWGTIVVALAVLIIGCICVEIGRRVRSNRCRSMLHDSSRTAHPRRHSHHVVRMGSEREAMFVPGDPFPWQH